MAFDSSVVSCFVDEAKELIINSKIDKIHQPQKDELLIALRGSKGNLKLYISANPSYPRIYFLNEKYENPSVPPMFCMLLRKLLTSNRITDIYQVNSERIIVLELEGYDELRELTKRKLIIEIMGKHSNIILTDINNVIIDSIKRIDISTSSKRQILPQLTYKFPPSQEGKLLPVCKNIEKVDISPEDVFKSVMTHFSGISKLTAREIEFISETVSPRDAIYKVFEQIESKKYSPCIIYTADDVPVDFSAIDITQYSPEYKIERNNSISYIIEKFYREKALHLRMSQNTAHMTKIINNNIDRCKKKLAIFNQQLLDSAKRDKYKQYGELITANLYKITDRTDSIEVTNYFDPEMPTIKINLSKELSPAKNAQKYFTKYNKAKNAEVQAYIQIKSVTKELEYLESVLDATQRVTSVQEIKEIKSELIQEGYIISQTTSKKNKDTVSAPKKFIIDSYTVYVGKNNRQNDYLTLKIARSCDMWLHTKNIPGSHVIICKKPDTEFSDEIITEAAKLAATNSKAKGSAKTAVDYTTVKNVKKPSGAKPGMVIYDHYNTVYVTP